MWVHMELLSSHRLFDLYPRCVCVVSEMLEYLYAEGGLERPETGTDEELIKAAAAETCDTPKEGMTVYSCTLEIQNPFYSVIQHVAPS